MHNRVLAIGDVHGCYAELCDLLTISQYQPGVDELVFVGDFVDRGPDPRSVIQLVMSLHRASPGKVHACLGNHDEKLVRWHSRSKAERETGVPNPMRRPCESQLAQWESFSPDEIEWIHSLPVVVDSIPGWLAVHAGFEEKPFEQQRSDKMIRVRWLKPDGTMAPLQDELDQPPGTIHWSERWTGPRNVVYGHAVHSLERPRVDVPIEGVECWGIDTGACFGGRLTALDLNSKAIFQVQARAKYAHMGTRE